MQTDFNYDCTPRFVHSCVFCASRSSGKERDAESGLDYFGARYYAGNIGRWISPDWSAIPQAIPYATYAGPQSLNLYHYMRNNPLGGVDPDGHCCWDWIKQHVESAGIGLLKGLGIMATAQVDLHTNVTVSQTIDLFHTPTDASAQQNNGPSVTIPDVFIPNGTTETAAAGVTVVGLNLTGEGEEIEALGAALRETIEGTLADLNKSLASQEMMDQLVAGRGEAFAGPGTKTIFRDANEAAARYGGDPGDWQKVRSFDYTPNGSEGTTAGFETHALQNVKTGQVVEMKNKIDPN